MNFDLRQAALAGLVLLAACEGSDEDRLANAARDQIEEAVDEVKHRADEAGKDLKAARKDLEKEAERAADEVDFGSGGEPRQGGR